MIGWWFATRTPRLRGASLVAAAACFCAPLIPLVIFNVQTGGTFSTVAGNFGESYYGVRNSALLSNLSVRLSQLGDVLEGGHLWYVGGVHVNPVAPVLACVLLVAGLLVDWRTVAPPFGLVAAAVAMSLFSISDLFITHYALMLPLIMATVGVSVAAIAGWKPSIGWGARLVRAGMAVMVGLWLLVDVRSALQYHADLSKSGGLADHSDASYHLAYYLQYGGFGSPIALDWGMDSTVRYLSHGEVTPIEIFGYDSPVEPDAGFRSRLGSFLKNPDNVYLLRSPGQEVFNGRRVILEEEAAAMGLALRMEQGFAQRDGTPLYEIWRTQ
jgi:hypothetical protein